MPGVVTSLAFLAVLARRSRVLHGAREGRASQRSGKYMVLFQCPMNTSNHIGMNTYRKLSRKVAVQVVLALGTVAAVFSLAINYIGDFLEPEKPYDPLQAHAGVERSAVISGAELKHLYFSAKVSPNIDRIRITEVYPVGYPSRQKVLHEIKGNGLFQELDMILEFQDTPLGDLLGGHRCRGEANIYFLKKSRRSPLSWNFAHGRFFSQGLLSPDSNMRLLAWFESKGYSRFRLWQEELRDPH